MSALRIARSSPSLITRDPFSHRKDPVEHRAARFQEFAVCWRVYQPPRGGNAWKPRLPFTGQRPFSCRRQYGRNIAASMDGYRGVPAIGMPKLLVRTALANLGKTKAFQNGDYFVRSENRNVAHISSTQRDCLGPYELRFHCRLAIRQDHCVQNPSKRIQGVSVLCGRGGLGQGRTGPVAQANLLRSRRKPSTT